MNDATSTDGFKGIPEASTLPIAFQAFHALHAPEYLIYATSLLYEDDTARDLVDEVFAQLADHWDHVMTQANPAAYAWALLRHVVEAESKRRKEHLALVQKHAFSYALRREFEPILRDIDTHAVTDLEIGITVAAAVLELSGAKLDVILLHCLNDLSMDKTAAVMGIESATVRSLLCQARAKLEARLAPRRLLRLSSTAHADEE
ncbi:sigma-70 family RNA polymerase sigma factor [Kitasatospora sp. HPMI-4]|uniref:sigma-70 family RNA polymerase sigma factor n=1 Tax=Kitasatospora sp. HPMI-4 TaxID=3448443 RepID=UPI003F19D413